MTTLTATGNINYFLDTNIRATVVNSLQSFTDLDSVTFVLGNCIFAVMTDSSSLEIESPSRATLILDSGPELGTATMEGQGFGSNSGVISSISFDALYDDAWDWKFVSNVSWSVNSIPKVGPVKALEWSNEELGQQFVLKGSINVGGNGEPSGFITSITAHRGDITVLLKGKIDVANGGDGHINLIRVSDSEGGRVALKGNYDIADLGFLTDPDPEVPSQGTLESLLQNEDLFVGRDVMRVSSNEMIWNGFDGDDLIIGGAQGDSLTGGDGDDRLNGFNGNDELSGGSGNDHLSGLADDDRLDGGEGNDVLIGGLGADDYVFDAMGPAHADTVKGFRAQQGDRIVLDSEVFASLAGGILDINLISGANAVAQTEVQYLVFDSSSHKLYYDADGNGGAPAVLIATLPGVNVLTAEDFELIPL